MFQLHLFCDFVKGYYLVGIEESADAQRSSYGELWWYRWHTKQYIHWWQLGTKFDYPGIIWSFPRTSRPYSLDTFWTVFIWFPPLHLTFRDYHNFFEISLVNFVFSSIQTFLSDFELRDHSWHTWLSSLCVCGHALSTLNLLITCGCVVLIQTMVSYQFWGSTFTFSVSASVVTFGIDGYSWC